MIAGVSVLLVLLAVTTTWWPPAPRESTVVDSVEIAERMTDADPMRMVEAHLPAEYVGSSPEVVAERVAADPLLAMERSGARPDPDSPNPTEAAFAALVTGMSAEDSTAPGDVYQRLPRDVADWLAVVFPGVVGNLAGAPFENRVTANRIRLAASVAESTYWPGPDRPWHDEREPRADFQRVIDGGHRLVYLDPLANDGQGSWVELVGDLSTARHVGVLVPGGSAFISSDNFTRYSDRAGSFVDAAGGDLAMLVWAGSPFPSGWIQEAGSSWAADAAPRLAEFLADLRRQVGGDTTITLAGHSYGGAVVGMTETYDIDVDRVMHIASAGAGYGVSGPRDYTSPCRTRYDLMAPGDPIGYVQDVPGFTGLGHGVEVADMPGVLRLVTGSLPDDPQALDDVNRTLGSLGITGKEIGGIHAHSEVFIPNSDAWSNMLAVFTGEEPRLLTRQPPALPGCD
ncbi:alpha/beta hydrolase family protein [Stackebrandtia albiflava]|uniref:Alpha/beta hydrolase family protein n=1 Tax=Stackebrandtia albiflava TaxID=406432 RepID=A0A562UQQ5_9ACTN|nr:alpha/beta hydrolase family protein [Stackebrandtia albiflava]